MMKTQKIKHYRLSVSRTFPANHPKAGQPTYFVEKINNAIGDTEDCNVVINTRNGVLDIWPKIHTIRSNYDLWGKRIGEVQRGEAVIELFYWSDKPYRSKQVVFFTLDKDSGCGVQKLIHGEDSSGNLRPRLFDTCEILEERMLAHHDGLSLEDFKAWFKGADLSEPMAIIHFTPFRY